MTVVIHRNSRVRAIYLTAGLFAALASSHAAAQLTVENLIGQAVSTSNQQYPDIEDAIQRFSNNDFNAAKTYLERAKKKHPKLPPTEVTLAKLFISRRDGQRARLLLEQAVSNAPDDPEAYLMLADDAFRVNRVTESDALFEKAERLTEDFNENAKRKRNFQIRVLAGKGAVAQRRGKWDVARQNLEKWIALDDENALAHQRLGGVLFNLEKIPEAYKEFETARELRGELNHPHVSLAQLFASKSDHDKARENFDKAYAAEPENDSTAQSFASWLLQRGEYDQAQQVSNRLREKNPDSETALLLAGVVAQLKGERDKAEEALSKLIEIDPTNAKARAMLALLLVESNKVSDQERALRHAQVNAERFPNNPQTQVTLAWVQHKLGRERESSVALQKGTQAGNLTADSGYLVARILADRDQKEKALKILQEMLKPSENAFLYRRDAETLYQELGGNLQDLGAK